MRIPGGAAFRTSLPGSSWGRRRASPTAGSRATIRNVAERVIDLVRRLYVDLGSPAQPRDPARRPSCCCTRRRIIDANLGDPGLGPEQVARACFISTRYLYRVFEREGLGVCEWIRCARLDRCRRDLVDPAFADQSIVAIASRWGFPNAPHFSRLFREAYGCSPRDYRHNGGPDAAAAAPADRGALFRPRAGRREHEQAWARAGWKS